MITKGEAYNCFEGVKLPIVVPVETLVGNVATVRQSDLYEAGVPYGSVSGYRLSFVVGHDCEVLEITNQERVMRRDLLRDRKRALLSELAEVDAELEGLV